MSADEIWTPGYARLSWSETTGIIIPDLSPTQLYEIILRDVSLPVAGQLVALSSPNADGSSADVTGYEWSMGGMSSANPSTTGVSPTNFIIPTNQKGNATTSWNILYNIDFVWTKIGGTLIYD